MVHRLIFNHSILSLCLSSNLLFFIEYSFPNVCGVYIANANAYISHSTMDLYPKLLLGYSIRSTNMAWKPLSSAWATMCVATPNYSRKSSAEGTMWAITLWITCKASRLLRNDTFAMCSKLIATSIRLYSALLMDFCVGRKQVFCASNSPSWCTTS